MMVTLCILASDYIVLTSLHILKTVSYVSCDYTNYIVQCKLLLLFGSIINYCSMVKFKYFTKFQECMYNCSETSKIRTQPPRGGHNRNNLSTMDTLRDPSVHFHIIINTVILNISRVDNLSKWLAQRVCPSFPQIFYCSTIIIIIFKHSNYKEFVMWATIKSLGVIGVCV